LSSRSISSHSHSFNSRSQSSDSERYGRKVNGDNPRRNKASISNRFPNSDTCTEGRDENKNRRSINEKKEPLNVKELNYLENKKEDECSKVISTKVSGVSDGRSDGTAVVGGGTLTPNICANEKKKLYP